MKYFLLFITMFLYSEDYFYEFGKKVELTPVMDTRGDIAKDIHIYKTRDGKTIKFKHEIMIKFKDGVDKDSFFKKFDIKNYKQLTKNVYLVKPSSKEDVVSLAKNMYESNMVVYAIPNKINSYKKR